jgi:MoaA/NifB/PqqE/SkfB family radical SAM enzyme|tara:strand:- start:5436 stop:5888 length:453 start_codon:yes stop_codon:yes gene_type:complete
MDKRRIKMVFLHSFKKKLLKARIIMAKKKRMAEEKSLRKRIEIDKLERKARDAMKLKLSPEEKRFLAKRIKEKKMQKAKHDAQRKAVIQKSKKIGAGILAVTQKLSKVAGSIQGFDDEPRKKRKKKVVKRRKKRVVKRRKKKKSFRVVFD